MTRTLGKIIIIFGVITFIIGLFNFTETTLGYYSSQSDMGFVYMCLGYLIIKQDTALKLK